MKWMIEVGTFTCIKGCLFTDCLFLTLAGKKGRFEM